MNWGKQLDALAIPLIPGAAVWMSVEIPILLARYLAIIEEVALGQGLIAVLHVDGFDLRQVTWELHGGLARGHGGRRFALDEAIASFLRPGRLHGQAVLVTNRSRGERVDLAASAVVGRPVAEFARVAAERVVPGAVQRERVRVS